MADEERKVVEGITLSADGHAQIDQAIVDEIFGIAILLDEKLDHPVDVQHVVAAIVLAAEEGQLSETTVVRANDEELCSCITTYVGSVFRRWSGDVGEDDG